MIFNLRKIIGSTKFIMVATYFGVIASALVLLTACTVNMLNKNLYSAEEASVMAKANIISQMVGEVWSTDSEVSKERFAQPVQSSLSGTRIRGIVVDSSYKVLYDTSRDSEMSGKVFIRDVLKKTFDGEQAVMINDDGAEYKTLSVSVPVVIDNSIAGAVYLASSVDSIDNTINSARTSLVIFSIIIAVVIGMLSFGLSGIITKPLAEYRETARRISKGDFKARVKVKGQNEIAEMGETMNYMAKQLENIEDKRRKFVSDVSHELKTPMTGIKLICDTCETVEDPDMQKEFVGDIVTEVDRLSRLVDRLLILSRLDERKINLEQVDIKPLVEKIIRTLMPLAQKRNIDMYPDFKYESYPEIMIDYDKLFEAFYNIAENAIKYSPEGGRLRIDMDCDTENIIVSFSDNGPGIPEGEREKIFERFYRLDDSRARDTGGTGLGLAIAKEAIEIHGGKITVSAGKDGIGSVFTVSLPIRSEEVTV